MSVNDCSDSVGDWFNSLSFDSFERFSINIEMTNKIETSKFTRKRAQLQSIVNKKNNEEKELSNNMLKSNCIANG